MKANTEYDLNLKLFSINEFIGIILFKEAGNYLIEAVENHPTKCAIGNCVFEK